MEHLLYFKHSCRPWEYICKHDRWISVLKGLVTMWWRIRVEGGRGEMVEGLVRFSKRDREPPPLLFRVSPWRAAWASPESSLEMQTLRPHLNPQNQNVHFNRVPRRVVCTLQFEKPWWRQCGALNSLFLNPVLPASEKSWPHHPRDMRKTQIGLHQLCTLVLCISFISLL